MKANSARAHQKETAAVLLTKLGVFTTAQALDAGVSKPTIARLIKAKVIIRLEHGLYLSLSADLPDELEFISACFKFGPEALIGGLSALAYYSLTEHVPSQTWIMVPHSKRGIYSDKYRVLRTKHDPTIECDEHGNWRIATIERTLVEAFVYATKIGYQTALKAARMALAEEKVTEESLYEASEKLGAWPLMAKNWEAITTK